MKKENDEIVDLFRSRLSQAEMPVRADSWNQLNKGIAIASRRKRLLFMRVASAAAVLLVLIATSATIWMLSPRQEIEEAFTQLVNVAPGNINADIAYQNFTPPSPIAQTIKPHKSNSNCAIVDADSIEEDEFISVSFSYTITTIEEGGYSDAGMNNNYWYVGTGHNQTSSNNVTDESNHLSTCQVSLNEKKWSAKLYGGIALPNKYSNHKLPYTIGASVERRLNNVLSVEAGLQYSHIVTPDHNLHYIGIPVKLNATYIKTKKVDLYATVGGVADKCIAGAPNNDFKNEPIQLGVTAGLGAQYKINDQLTAFVEPGITHHFKTDSKLETIRSKRPTNFNALCGLRMTF